MSKVKKKNNKTKTNEVKHCQYGEHWSGLQLNQKHSNRHEIETTFYFNTLNSAPLKFHSKKKKKHYF